MPMTLVLENVPDELYSRLLAAAEANRRSLGNEVLACLKAALLPAPISAFERVTRARAIRQALPVGAFNAADTSRLRNEGRN